MINGYGGNNQSIERGDTFYYKKCFEIDGI